MNVYAIDIGQELGSNISKNYSSFSVLVSIILKNGLTIAGVILLALILFGGISYIMAAGSADQKKLAQAQDTITSAIIGFLVIFTSYFIIQIIQVVTGLKIL